MARKILGGSPGLSSCVSKGKNMAVGGAEAHCELPVGWGAGTGVLEGWGKNGAEERSGGLHRQTRKAHFTAEVLQGHPE